MYRRINDKVKSGLVSKTSDIEEYIKLFGDPIEHIALCKNYKQNPHAKAQLDRIRDWALYKLGLEQNEEVAEEREVAEEQEVEEEQEAAEERRSPSTPEDNDEDYEDDHRPRNAH